jgi:hypothetical protein
MDVPPEIAFRNVESTPAVEDKILDGIDRLEKVYDRLTSVRIMVEDPNPGRESGQLYHVRIDMGVPSKGVVVHHKPPEDPREDVVQVAGEAGQCRRAGLGEAFVQHPTRGPRRSVAAEDLVPRRVGSVPAEQVGHISAILTGPCYDAVARRM